MKTLILMRHAKSSWDDLFCPDQERPLSKRGRVAADKMGKWLVENDYTPDAVMLSTAKRVLETWEFVQKHQTIPPQARPLQSLYLTNAHFLLAHIRNTPKSIQTLLVINHEPTLSLLTAALATPPLSAECSRALQKFPTGAVAVFDVLGNWPTLSNTAARFTRFVKPKDLEG